MPRVQDDESKGDNNMLKWIGNLSCGVMVLCGCVLLIAGMSMIPNHPLTGIGITLCGFLFLGAGSYMLGGD